MKKVNEMGVITEGDEEDEVDEEEKKKGFWASVWNFSISFPTLFGT